MKDDPNVEYKIPVLYRSKKGGIKYRMSEILYPRDPKIIEANLLYNRKQMQNKLMELSRGASKDIQKKLGETLKSQPDNLLKAIRDSSARELLRDYIYFKSDLSKFISM